MTEFLARKLTPEQQQAKKKMIAEETLFANSANLDAYRQFDLDPADPMQEYIIKTLVRIRKHMKSYEVYGLHFIEHSLTETFVIDDLPEDRVPTDDEIANPGDYYGIPGWSIAWTLDDGEGHRYAAIWAINLADPDGTGMWKVITPNKEYPISTGDLYDDMDCVHSTVYGSYMMDHKLFSWQRNEE